MIKLNVVLGMLMACTLLSVSCGDSCEDLAPSGWTCDNDGNIICDVRCETGFAANINCQCVELASNLIPHPCPDLTCPAGEAVVVSVTACNCEQLASSVDPCMNVTCPDGFICNMGNCEVDPSVAQTIDVSGQITEEVTWTSGNTYILKDRVTVIAGVCLSIEPGVLVKGEFGTGANASALLIARGGQIKAEGTADAPIIFTAASDEIQPGEIVSPNLDPTIMSQWGGLIILGNAPISASADAVQIEGIPTSDPNGLYGGTDPIDNSGILRYVSVRHGGTNIGEGNEINGITFGGVGSGTKVEYVEVVGTADDGLEFFGGTVSVSHAAVWNNGDDAFDTDQAWSGTLDNALTINPGDSPFELDGPEGSFTSTGHTITNVTSFGGGQGDRELIDVDASTDVSMISLVFADFASDARVSSDFADYTANTNGYSISGIEAVFGNGGDAASVFGVAEELVTTAENLAQTRGGVDASAFEGWAWTSFSDAYSAIANAQANPEVRVIDLPANIDSDMTLTSGDIYILTTRTTVLAGATLNIEPGVVIKGVPGQAANASALLIARGGTLNAMGTAEAPIIMTTTGDQIMPGQIASPNLTPDIVSQWGGLIILGNAPISASAEAVQIEGIPTSDSNGLYGGTDPMDNSGKIRYVSVRHGGTNIGEGNEINGITLGGVGAGTLISNVEVVGTADDGIEFFGGTVNVTNALIWNNGDDAFDTDQAWSGTLDNAITVNPGDSPFELDGPEGTFMSTGHTITNVTSFGGGQGDRELIDVDATTDVSMSNLLFFGFAPDSKISSDYADYAANANGFAIQDIQASFDNGGDAATVFGDAAGLVTTINGVGEASTGANAAAFAWTWAGQSALASLGL